MKKILISFLLLISYNSVIAQSNKDTLSFNDFNYNSLKFIEWIIQEDNVNDLSSWYRGKIDENFSKTLHKIKELSHIYPDSTEIRIIPFGQIPQKNEPLRIIYHLKELNSDNDLGFIFTYLDDGDLILDHISRARITDFLIDSIRNPPPAPPRN